MKGTASVKETASVSFELPAYKNTLHIIYNKWNNFPEQCSQKIDFHSGEDGLGRLIGEIFIY